MKNRSATEKVTKPQCRKTPHAEVAKRDRQARVAELIRRGLSLHDVAQELDVHVSTVRSDYISYSELRNESRNALATQVREDTLLEMSAAAATVRKLACAALRPMEEAEVEARKTGDFSHLATFDVRKALALSREHRELTTVIMDMIDVTA